MMWPGAFIIKLTPEAQDWLLDTRCRAVKSLHHDPAFWARYKAAVPDSYTWGRYWWASDLQEKLRYASSGLIIGNMLSELLVATNLCPYDALLGPNEYAPEWISDLEWLRVMAAEKEFAAAAHSIGKDYWALSMSTHNLPPAWVVKALAPFVDGFSLHLYSCDQPWWELDQIKRYREFILACPVPVLIGEWGRDCLAQRGWQKQNPPVGDKGITWEAEWAATSNLGAYAFTPFAFGCTDDWRDRGFEWQNNEVYRQMVKNWGYRAWKRPGGVYMPEFQFGFKVLADGLGKDIVGEPIEDQWRYILADHLVVRQRSTKGYMEIQEVPAHSGQWGEAHFYAASKKA